MVGEATETRRRLKGKMRSALAFLPGMTLLVRGLEVVDGQLGVVSERVQGLVAEQFLDVVKIGSAPDQLRGATAPEGVRRDLHVEARLVGVEMHAAQERFVGHPFAEAIEEQRRFVRVAHEERAHGSEIAFQQAQGGLADGHDALLVAFAEHDGRETGQSSPLTQAAAS
jgi:hypothetical protein